MKDSCAFKHVRTQKDLIWVAVEGSYKLQSISLRRENHTRQTNFDSFLHGGFKGAVTHETVLNYR